MALAVEDLEVYLTEKRRAAARVGVVPLEGGGMVGLRVALNW